VWLRDQCYAGLAIAADVPYPLLADAVRFCTARVLDDGDRLAPAYRPDGTRYPNANVEIDPFEMPNRAEEAPTDNLPGGHPTETTYPSRRRTTFRSIQPPSSSAPCGSRWWSTA
jgi:hypothetical protein